MIHYAKGYWGLPLFLRLHGSPFPRTLPFAIVSVSITIWLHLWEFGRESIVESFAHPYPFQVYGFVIGFLVVMRTNHSLARFMEARTGVETMGSTWADCVAMLTAFDGCTVGSRSQEVGKPAMKQDHEHHDDHARFVARLTHLISLMHAMALQNLRGDEELGNIVPARNRRQTNNAAGPEFTRVRDRASKENAVDIVDAEDEGISGYLGTKTSGKTTRLLAARYHHMGAHLIHAETDDGKQARQNIVNPFLLQENDELWAKCCAATPLAVIGGLDPHELKELDELDCDRTYLVQAWIQALIIRRFEDAEGIRVSPPILSRVHQCLTNGMLGFNMADKIAKTPFPMPYAQMLSVCLVVFNLTMPIMVAGHIKHLWLAILVNFISTGAYQGLNEVARELEDPFKPVHINDHGMPQLQAMFNSKVRAASPAVRKTLAHWAQCDSWDVSKE
jgi:predicted membrane chloride channel (bestrophin family)